MAMITTNDLKNGYVLDVDGDLVSVVSFQHVKPGKGGAFVRTKLKNMSSGAVVDKTFRAGEKVERVTTESRTMQFLYRDGDDLYLMDNSTYEQLPVAAALAVRCPMLLVHGTADRCQPPSRSRALAELTGARLVIVEGGSHLIPGRHPVLANLLIRDFARDLGGA